MGSPELRTIAAHYGVSVPQLCIRYCLQLNLVALPKASSVEHIRANAQVDFEISQEDMEVLCRLSPITDYSEASRFPVYGGRL